MAPDEHINKMLAICQDDPELKLSAWLLLDAYRGRGLTISITGGTPAEKEVLMMRSREKLRTELCDLIQPLDLDRTGKYPTTSPAADPTQQTTPGA